MPTLNLNHYPDVLGQLPRLKTYTHILLCFGLEDDEPPSQIIEGLEAAARRLADAFPWIACQVVHEGARPGNSGVFRLAPCSEFSSPNSIFRVEDCTSVVPRYQEILSARGPTTMLDGKILGPVPAFPHVYSDSELNPAPVLTIQANIVRGGLLLDVAAQHNFIDGGGLLRLIEYLARALRNEPFTPEELEHGNRDRTNLVKLLGPDEPMLDHSHLIREPLPPSHQTKPESHQAEWHFVRFPASTVAHLKQLANSSFSSPPESESESGQFVSTNDAISAYIWKSVSSVRRLRRRNDSPDVEGEQLSKFSRALDARRALGVPREYLGQMGFNATCHLTFSHLESMSLGEVALHMRRAVEKANSEYAVRSWATLVAREEDKSRIMFGGQFDPDKDLGMSSLIHASVEGTDFGPGLGRPDLVRRPLFQPLGSCVYLWTKTERGEVDVLLCLKEQDWEGLARLDGWKDMVEFIG
ncbi:transferase family-domain-containing protein [Cladorrhinum samala]|uniref:Transferase family-domain-containing protein n=1 Tax=Cladorrhinum samala TaxID=585594 RepID=A0AAV9HXR6_9PEZI|nr:transferase family-domain-containing protein [Cladorrhinum samala]